MRKVFEFGGYAAAAILIAFGVGALVLGINGREDVRDNLAQEKIEGSDDMTPDEIRSEIEQAGITVEDVPDCSVAGKLVDTGDEARCFAEYMRIHALESSGGRVYSEMGRYLTPDGKETSDPAKAAKENGRPVANQARDLWVTETALATALNVAFFAEQVSNFGIVVAIALILAGIGFAVLAFAALRWLPGYEARRSAAGP
jgi:hypothetical protein